MADAWRWTWEEEAREEWEEREEVARPLRLQGRECGVESALRELRISKAETLAVFLLGSRLWGSAKENSDFDLFIVTTKKRGSEATAMHSRNLDAIVMTVDELNSRVERMRLPEILLSDLPEECVWYVSGSFSPPSPKNFSRETLVNSVRAQSVKDWKRAEKLRARNELQHSQKVFIHTVRYALLARQFITRGRIYLWTCAQPYVECLQYDFDNSEERWMFLAQRLEALLLLLAEEEGWKE